MDFTTFQATIGELLAQWKTETPLEPEDMLPDIADMIAKPEDIF